MRKKIKGTLKRMKVRDRTKYVGLGLAITFVIGLSMLTRPVL